MDAKTEILTPAAEMSDSDPGQDPAAPRTPRRSGTRWT